MKSGMIKVWQTSEVKLSYRTTVPSDQLSIIRGSQDAFEMFRRYWDIDSLELLEEFKVLFMDRRGRALAMMLITQGGIDCSLVDCRLIFIAALKIKANSIICCHNHPSGGLNPGKEDNNLTEKLIAAGQLLNIQILDHLIITNTSYYSFKDEGLITFRREYLGCE